MMPSHAISNSAAPREGKRRVRPRDVKSARPMNVLALLYGPVAALTMTLVTLAAIGQSAAAADRVALIIAAEKYKRFPQSAISTQKMGELQTALQSRNFDTAIITDPSNATARAALRDFSRKAESATFALIVLSGHIATYRSQSFFLPANATVRRSTDLLSRGLSVGNLIGVADRAKAGAVMFLTTVPDISSALPGIGTRPSLAVKPPENVVAVFSNSEKVPVSQVDSVSNQAASELIAAAGSEPAKLSALIEAASAGGRGTVIGNVPDEALAATDPAAARAKQEAAKQEVERVARARAEAERKARAAAERAREAERRAKLAEDRAREAEQRAQEEAEQRARDERERARREADAKRRAASERDEAKKATESQPVAAPPGGEASDVQSLKVVEALLGKPQRRAIQARLRSLGLYTGQIDAVFGPRTRAAIKGFQTSKNLPATGYLTPKQFEMLVETAR